MDVFETIDDINTPKLKATSVINPETNLIHGLLYLDHENMPKRLFVSRFMFEAMWHRLDKDCFRQDMYNLRTFYYQDDTHAFTLQISDCYPLPPALVF